MSRRDNQRVVRLKRERAEEAADRQDQQDDPAADIPADIPADIDDPIDPANLNAAIFGPDGWPGLGTYLGRAPEGPHVTAVGSEEFIRRVQEHVIGEGYEAETMNGERE